MKSLFYKNEEGSTLLMVIIMVAVLSVLGTSVLAMAFMNYNMKYSDYREKKTLYYSEAGLDQVYSKLGKYVDQAIVTASNNTKAQVLLKEADMISTYDDLLVSANGIINNNVLQQDYYTAYVNLYGNPGMNLSQFMDNKLYYKVMLHPTQTYIASTYGNYKSRFLILECEVSGSYQEVDLSSNTTTYYYVHQPLRVRVDEEALIEYTKNTMKDQYKAYFNDLLVQTQLITDIESNYVYLDPEINAGNSIIDIEVNPGNADKIDSFAEGDPNTFVLKNVTSTFTYLGTNQKTLVTDLIIEVPGDIYPLSLTQNLISTKNNPLWQYGIVSQESIYFEGATSQIDGSIYSYGYNPTGSYSLAPTDPNSPRESKNYKGVIASASNADVTINGDVISRSYVQIASGTSNSSIAVNSGHVYCDSFVVQSGSTGGTLTVNNGNVYTKDDIELNGTLAEISIQGSYYGFVGTAKNFNQTSSIVINSDLSNSKLSISGDYATINNNEPADKAGIIISGTSYINDSFTPDPNPSDDGSLYQTGESVGIKGNYLAYALPLTDNISTDPYFISGMDPATLVTTLGQTTGLSLYYRYQSTINGSLNNMTAEEKAKYFMQNTVENNYPITNGAGNVNIRTDKVVAAQGAVIGVNASGVAGTVYVPNATVISDFAEKEILRDYVFITNYLRHRNSQDIYNNFLGTAKKLTELSVLELLSLIDGSKVIDDYSKIENAVNSFDLVPTDLRSGVKGVTADDSKEVAIVVNTGSSNILLLGSNYDSAYAGFVEGFNSGNNVIGGQSYYVIKGDVANPDEMKGVIITTGSIRISGELDFYGSLIAKKDIVLEESDQAGVQEINIMNNTEEIKIYLAQLIMKSAKLSDVFNESTSGGRLAVSLGDLDYTTDIKVETGDIDAMRQYYYEFINYRNWRIEE